MIVWVDIETTGLNPERDFILEVGIVATTDGLSYVDGITRTVKPPLRGLHPSTLDPVVRKMHEESGLLEEVPWAGLPVDQVEAELVRWLEDRGFTNKPMAGSSIQFDRSFLKAQMPTLESQFHYRNIDVSTIKELAKLWYPEDAYRAPGPAVHRAMPDIMASINELMFYKTSLFRVRNKGDF